MTAGVLDAPAVGTGRRGIVAVTLLATFLAFLDATIVNVAFPALEASFPGATRSSLSWVLNGYHVVFAALLLPAGRLGDVFSHRRLFLAGVALFAAASAACAAAPSVEVLIAARLAQAAGAAVVMPTALALLLSAYPREQRVAAVALGGAAAGLAAALGPSLGGLLVIASDWRTIFLVNVPLGALVCWYGRALLPDVARRGARVPDLLGTALLAGAVGLAAFGLVQAPEWGWGDARVVAGFAAAAVVAPLAVARALRHPVPALDLALLRARDVAVANLATLVLAPAFFAKILIDVLFLTAVWDYSALQAGLALTPSPLVTAAAAGAGGALAQRLGHRWVVVAGAALYALGVGWYAVAMPADGSYVADYLPATLFTGVGMAFALPMLASAAVTRLPPEELGAGAGINATARQLGGVLGIAVVVAILGSPEAGGALDRFHASWAFIAIVALAAALIATRLRPDGSDALPFRAPDRP